MMDKPTTDGLVAIFRLLGILSNDSRLNDEEKGAIAFVAGYTAAGLEDQYNRDFTEDFYRGSKE